MRIVKSDIWLWMRQVLLDKIIGIVCLFGLFNCHTVRAVHRDTDKPIVILYDNDVHCAIDGYGKMEQLRNAISDTAWVAVTSSGDFLQGGAAGALSHGKYIADIMQAMGYDAVTLGNHEFDFGIPRMKELLCSADIPVTCINLRDVKGDSTLYAPYIIKKYRTRKIAYIGVVTPSTLESEAYAFYNDSTSAVYDICGTSVYELVQQTVDEVRGKGADYVIVLAHLGERQNMSKVDSHGLVAATTGIDAVLDGHTHSVVECCMVPNAEGHPVPVTQTGTKFANIGKLHINRHGGISAHLIPTSDVLPVATGKNGKVKCTVDSIISLMSAVTEVKVCHSDFPLVIDDGSGRQLVRYSETNAGDIVTDALRAYTNADMAIVNGGDIRTEIPAGDITVGDVVAMLPYANPVAVVNVTGRALKELLEVCCQYAPVESGDFPQVAGMRFTLRNGTPNRVIDLQILDSTTNTFKPVQAAATYTLATMEYALTGGGLHGKLKNAVRVKNFQTSETQVLIWYMREKLNGVLPDKYAGRQGRIM